MWLFDLILALGCAGFVAWFVTTVATFDWTTKMVAWNITALIAVLGLFGAGLGLVVTQQPPPLTVHQSWEDGFGNALSDAGYSTPPWGAESCITDWNGQGTNDYNGNGLDGQDPGFADGGPVVTRLLTSRDQNTGTVLGQAWMAGCRAGLRYTHNGQLLDLPGE